MEVLTRPIGGIHTSLGDQTPYWTLTRSNDRFNTDLPLFGARYGPRPPPSPPREMSKKYSLPPIADLLAISQRDDGRRSGESGSQRAQMHLVSSNAADPEQHQRDSSHSSTGSPRSHPRATSRQTSMGGRLERPHSAWSHTANEQEMHPPLTLQPTHKIDLVDSSLFLSQAHRQSAHTSPVLTRPTVNTSLPWPSYSQTSPYPSTAPASQAPYGEVSPHSTGSTLSLYGGHQREYSYSAPAGPPSQSFRSDHPYGGRNPATLPPPKGMVDDSASRRYNPAPYLPHPPISPTMVKMSVGAHGPYHPYAHHSRRSSHTSSGSMPGHAGFIMATSPLHASSGIGGHSGNYTCEICDKRFSRPSSLRIHSHSHTGEKPFVCPRTGCGKAFSVRSNMKRHERGCHIGGATQLELQRFAGEVAGVDKHME